MAIWKSRSPIAYLHSILPYSEFSVGSRNRIVQLDHYFHARPFIPFKILGRWTAIHHIIAITTASVIPAFHISPIKVGVHGRLLNGLVGNGNPAVTQSADTCPWVGPGSGGTVAAKPYSFMMNVSF